MLNFTAHSHDEACGSSNITINGVPLPQEWEGDYASGSGSYQYTGQANLQQNDQLPRDLALAWNSTCLHGNAETDEAAQILTVNIKSIDGVPINTPSGFTISFKQNSFPPSLLRLETIPDLAPELSDIWRDPPANLRLVFGNTTASSTPSETVPTSLEDEIRELKVLQAELAAIQQAVATKKQYINSQIRKEAKCLTEELKQCDSVSCFFKTVAGKAHGAWRVVTLRLHSSEQSTDMGRPEEAFASAHVGSQRYGSINVANSANVATSTTSAPAGPQSSRAAEPRPYEGSTGELPPRPQQRQAPYVVALEIALGVLCCGCLVAIIRHKCSSLRTRTERAADYEERYNARAYKRAARRHAWRNWWRGNWRKDASRIADYEEKRALIVSQESILEDAMQEEIRQLRVAHTVVNDIIRAEEGRTTSPSYPAVAPLPLCTCTHRPPFTPGPPSATSTYPPSTIPEGPSRPLSRTDSLPSYRSRAPSEPPTYESDAEPGSYVANGFVRYEMRGRAYTASAGSQAGESGRWTPESSVVDVSPRPSAETLRHPMSVFTVDESESEEE